MSLKKIALIVMISWSLNVFGSGNILIDGKKIKNNEELQLLLKKQNINQLNNKGLDGIYESLIGDLKTDTIFKIKNLGILKSKLGEQYVNDLIEVVNLAAEDNTHVVLVLE